MKVQPQRHEAHKAVGPQVESLAHRVIGAAIAVHRALGPGHLESVYENALAVELRHLGIKFQQQAPVNVSYRDESVGEGRIDLLIEQSLVVELKAAQDLAPVFQAQVLSYLKSTNLRLGLLIHFNVPVLKDGIRRIVL